MACIRCIAREKNMSGDGHGVEHADPSNKRIGLLIAVLALILAFSETLGKGAQTAALSYNVEASNLWAFFQAKTVRMTTLRTAGELLELELAPAGPQRKEALEKRISDWRKTAERYDNEPETGEGRKQLAARAKQAEEKRDRSLAAYHHYELASAAVQIGIVLASATVITGMVVLAWLAGGLGVVGIVFSLIAFFAPTAVHLF